jgi:hypothetical protein
LKEEIAQLSEYKAGVVAQRRAYEEIPALIQNLLKQQSGTEKEIKDLEARFAEAKKTAEAFSLTNSDVAGKLQWGGRERLDVMLNRVTIHCREYYRDDIVLHFQALLQQPTNRELFKGIVDNKLQQEVCNKLLEAQENFYKKLRAI